MQNENSGVNTVLIVIVLLILVGFGVWWFRGAGAPSDTTNGELNVDVNLPTGSEGTGQN
jgi:hypothetical protein